LRVYRVHTEVNAPQHLSHFAPGYHSPSTDEQIQAEVAGALLSHTELLTGRAGSWTLSGIWLQTSLKTFSWLTAPWCDLGNGAIKSCGGLVVFQTVWNYSRDILSSKAGCCNVSSPLCMFTAEYYSLKKKLCLFSKCLAHLLIYTWL
jgi:hypothetical protein